jgi:hypothetical protein
MNQIFLIIVMMVSLQIIMRIETINVKFDQYLLIANINHKEETIRFPLYFYRLNILYDTYVK